MKKWIYTEDKNPMTYKTGVWDGKNSDIVLAEDIHGNMYLAFFNEGFMDGSEFKDWYDNRDYLIGHEIVRWIKIPD